MCSASGTDHLGTEEEAGLRLGVHVQDAAVAQHHARAPLVLERHHAGDVAHMRAPRQIAAAAMAICGIREDDAEPGAPSPGRTSG
jgi:hypothetical protein